MNGLTPKWQNTGEYQGNAIFVYGILTSGLDDEVYIRKTQIEMEGETITVANEYWDFKKQVWKIGNDLAVDLDSDNFAVVKEGIFFQRLTEKQKCYEQAATYNTLEHRR